MDFSGYSPRSSALNKPRDSDPYPVAAAAVATIRRLLLILTLDAVVPAVQVNPITGRRKGCKRLPLVSSCVNIIDE